MNLTLNVYHDVRRGGRNYMEDVISVVTYDKNEAKINNSYPFACFLVFDGHGGVEAAKFAEENLLNQIKLEDGFYSNDDETVVKAIKNGFLSTHELMWKVVDTWPKTQHGLLSTSGTTASMVLIRKGKMYVAHVGDSTVVVGEESTPQLWRAKILTTDHKPDSMVEKRRIEKSGGEVMWKSGVPRVVWRRERIIKLSTKKVSTIDCVPFLAVARSLGDLWSYNKTTDSYSVSPEPDISVHEINLSKMKCLVLASDGLWNVLSAHETVKVVKRMIEGPDASKQKDYFSSFSWSQYLPLHEINSAARDPSTALVEVALAKCRTRFLRADNTSAIVVLFEEDKSNMTVEGDTDESPKEWNITVNILSKHESLHLHQYNGTKNVSTVSSPCLPASTSQERPEPMSDEDDVPSKISVYDALYKRYLCLNNNISNETKFNNMNATTTSNIISLPQISSFVSLKKLNGSLMNNASPHKCSLINKCECEYDTTANTDECPIQSNGKKDNNNDNFNLFEICKSASQNDETTLFSDNIIPQTPVCFVSGNKDCDGETSYSNHITSSPSCPNFSDREKLVDQTFAIDKEMNCCTNHGTDCEESNFSILQSIACHDYDNRGGSKSIFKISYPLNSSTKTLYTKLKVTKVDHDYDGIYNNESIESTQEINDNLKGMINSPKIQQSNNIDSCSNNSELNSQSNAIVKFRSESPSSSSSSSSDNDKEEVDNEADDVDGATLHNDISSTTHEGSTTLHHNTVPAIYKRKLHPNYACRRHRKQKLSHRTLTLSSHSNSRQHNQLMNFVKVCRSRLQLRRIQVCS